MNLGENLNNITKLIEEKQNLYAQVSIAKFLNGLTTYARGLNPGDPSLVDFLKSGKDTGGEEKLFKGNHTLKVTKKLDTTIIEIKHSFTNPQIGTEWSRSFVANIFPIDEDRMKKLDKKLFTFTERNKRGKAYNSLSVSVDLAEQDGKLGVINSFGQTIVDTYYRDLNRTKLPETKRNTQFLTHDF
ncbi:MAG: hypothetical protein FWD89_03095 [Firmicutes bacterium]|nr:hypothetical protein [Bacillota bacterium]MCL2771276.1 hypothetical protein [Bacillota bacterium]